MGANLVTCLIHAGKDRTPGSGRIIDSDFLIVQTSTAYKKGRFNLVLVEEVEQLRGIIAWAIVESQRHGFWFLASRNRCSLTSKLDNHLSLRMFSIMNLP